MLWYSLEHDTLLMSTHNLCICGEIRKIFCGCPSYLELCFDIKYLVNETVSLNNTEHLGPVVQSIISLRSSLMRNLLTVAVKVFSNVAKVHVFFFSLKKCE